MDKKALLSRIEINPQIMLGKPVIHGTRITVQVVLERLAAGETISDLCADYPHISKEDVQACLLFAAQSFETTSFVPLAQ